MYKLTDFSLKELRVLNAIVTKEINEKNHTIRIIENRIQQSETIRKQLCDKEAINLPELRTWSVQIHNAIDIVKQRETTHAN